jgi:FeoB-associated Cys-rich membrane protein
MIQNVIALSIVAIAGGYLAWRLWRFIAMRKSSTGCGSCGSCANPGDSAMASKPLVTIAPLPSAKR